MQADIRIVASHLHLIQSPEHIEAAMNDNLYVENRKVLLIKGFPAAKTAEILYKEFAKRADLRGEPF